MLTNGLCWKQMIKQELTSQLFINPKLGSLQIFQSSGYTYYVETIKNLDILINSPHHVEKDDAFEKVIAEDGGGIKDGHWSSMQHLQRELF